MNKENILQKSCRSRRFVVFFRTSPNLPLSLYIFCIQLSVTEYTIQHTTNQKSVQNFEADRTAMCYESATTTNWRKSYESNNIYAWLELHQCCALTVSMAVQQSSILTKIKTLSGVFFTFYYFNTNWFDWMNLEFNFSFASFFFWNIDLIVRFIFRMK